MGNALAAIPEKGTRGQEEGAAEGGKRVQRKE